MKVQRRLAEQGIRAKRATYVIASLFPLLGLAYMSDAYLNKHMKIAIHLAALAKCEAIQTP